MAFGIIRCQLIQYYFLLLLGISFSLQMQVIYGIVFYLLQSFTKMQTDIDPKYEVIEGILSRAIKNELNYQKTVCHIK